MSVLSGERFRDWRNEIGLLLAILLVTLLTVSLNRSYIDRWQVNLEEISKQTALLGIFALGATVVIISGGIDLSSGAVIAFSGVICLSLLLTLAPELPDGSRDIKNLPAWLIVTAILGTLLVAVLIGSFHAWLITAVNLPPFVATLASLVGLRSLAKVLVQDVTLLATDSRSTQVYVYDESFRMLGANPWIPVATFLALSLVTWALLSRTVTGRHLYAMGGNEAAARLSGIRTDLLKWLAYCYGSVTAALAGIFYAAYIGGANPATLGVGYELNAIAAAVVGGCSLQGGVGTVLGTMLGALFLRLVIDSVGKIVNVNSDDFQGLIVGVLVVLAVSFNELGSGSLRKRFFPGALGLVNVAILAALSGVIVGVMTENKEWKIRTGLIAAVAVSLVLGVKAFRERRASPRQN